MKRFVLDELQKWKSSKRRKPLIVKGARQIGKTWALQEFGRSFPDGYAYFNFDKESEYRQFFQSTKDVRRILQNLAMASGQKITTDTLIIFDEIQACPEALNSLKYFCEDAPEYYVASAGSLLGIKLSQGFPVGKVDFLEMGPMTFMEYLLADGAENLADYLLGLNEIAPIPDAFFNPLVEKLKMYFVVGGMPEPVLVWTEDGDIKEADRVLSDILMSYENDFAKHADPTDVPKVQLIWDSLPSQLARENKKFLYSAVKDGARAREYENALNWLYNADLARKTFRISKPGLPLSTYDDLTAFKIYMSDVGLLRKHSHLATSAFAEYNRLFTEFKGALTENFVLQSLSRQLETTPRYWAEAPYEVDFIVQLDNDIIPVECKAGTNVKSTSLKKYSQQYQEQTPLMVRFSLMNLSLDGNLLNIPLFLVDRAGELIRLALSK
ncbi:MAG: ATP-binding protein [Oscillospiraceae bacterium]|nr:ATP-binding protein [Oscillospiraceae bacterium]